MAYVDTLLGKNERIVARHHHHGLAWMPSLALGLLLTAAIIAVSLYVDTLAPGIGIFGLALIVLPWATLVTRFAAWRGGEYIVTPRRIMQTRGVPTKHVFDPSLDKINNVTPSQTVLGHMFSYGDLEILTGGEIGINKLGRIQEPVKFKMAMMNAKEGVTNARD